MQHQEHATDASGTRDLDQEGKDIKIALTRKDQQRTPAKESKTTISFTSLAQSAIPNVNAQKILINRITVKFVPDFFYIMERCQLLFISAKRDKTIKRDESLNIYSFTLYIAYSLMYAYLDTVNEVDPINAKVEDVLNVFRGCGFNQNKFPALASTWLDGLGKYIDEDVKRTFVPTLPTLITQGSYYDNYFLSEDTGHLLPNFRCMFSIIALFANPMTITIPPNNRTMNVKLGSDLSTIDPLTTGTTESRRNVYRIPGIERLTVKVDDEQLPRLVAITLAKTQWASNLERYLMLDTNVLRYLKESVTELFSHIDTCVYSNASAVGTSLTMIPLISTQQKQVIHPKVATPPTAAAGAVTAIPAVLIHSGYDHSSRVKSRTMIVNGHVDSAYQTPLVRIIDDVESVKIDGHVHVNPQDNWYTIEHEFQTVPITLQEANAYFTKL